MTAAARDFLSDGGEMGARMRAYDWESHPLGSPEEWPQALRVTIRLMLTTRHPVFIWWGPQLFCFYNDAYAQSLGPEKHPAMLGSPARIVWAEIWPIVGSDVEYVMAGKGATWHEDHLVPIYRHGRLDEVYWTYSYSPIDHAGGVGGVLVLCTETTNQVLTVRRREEEHKRLHRLFEQAPAFIIIMGGPQHVVEFVNDAHRAVFNSSDWIGKPIRAAFPSIAGQGFFEQLDEVYTTGRTFHAYGAEVQYRRTPKGPLEKRNLTFIYAASFAQDGKITGIFCEGFDVTEAHLAQERVRLGEQRFRAAVDAVSGTLWTNDAAGKMRGAQPGWEALTGQHYDEYQGYGWSKALHPDDVTPTIDAWEQSVAQRKSFHFQHRVRRAVDGQWRDFAIRATPVLDSKGEVVEWVGVHTDVTERLAVERALQDADRRKDIFIATLAHELRNPLAPIRNASLIAASPQATDAQRRWSQGVIDRQVRQMGLLLDDLLDVSRITRGTLQLRPERVELSVIIDTAVETARPLIDARRHELLLHLPVDPTWIVADALRLAQVLSNLLNNAAKYTEPGGRIELSVDSDTEALIVRIADSGIGIEPEMLPRIFEMFSQSMHAIDRAEGGLGIGLALVKGLVTLHGGTVEVRSAGVGRGSTFTVRLPRGTASGRPPAEDAAANPRPNVSRRVLVVDDNRDAAESLALLLSIEGHQTRTAHDGERALIEANDFRPDIVLLDIGLPTLNGYEVAKRMRAASWGRLARLIAVTGWGQAEDRQRAAEAGFDHHLVKPIDIRALSALLEPPRPQLTSHSLE